MRTGSLFFCYLRAAHSTWGQSLREYMCVDSSAAMLDLAEKLLKGKEKVYGRAIPTSKGLKKKAKEYQKESFIGEKQRGLKVKGESDPVLWSSRRCWRPLLDCGWVKLNRTGDPVFFLPFFIVVYCILPSAGIFLYSQGHVFLLGCHFILYLYTHSCHISAFLHRWFRIWAALCSRGLFQTVSTCITQGKWQHLKYGKCGVCNLKTVVTAFKPSIKRQTQHQTLENESRRNFLEQTFVVLLEEDARFFRLVPQVQFDVVVSAFSLSELPSKADRNDIVQTLWRKTSHFLVSGNTFFPSSCQVLPRFLCFSFSPLELVFIFDHFSLVQITLSHFQGLHPHVIYNAHFLQDPAPSGNAL